MADHGLSLMQAIDTVLRAQVPLAGGWHATRIESPAYPVGYIDLTSSAPQRGQGYYAELHRGVVSIWTRAPAGQIASPAEVFDLSERAHRLLGSAVLSSGSFVVQQFQCGALTPRPPDDGLTWGRIFTFSALTHEVQNG